MHHNCDIFIAQTRSPGPTVDMHSQGSASRNFDPSPEMPTNHPYRDEDSMLSTRLILFEFFIVPNMAFALHISDDRF